MQSQIPLPDYRCFSKVCLTYVNFRTESKHGCTGEHGDMAAKALGLTRNFSSLCCYLFTSFKKLLGKSIWKVQEGC